MELHVRLLYGSLPASTNIVAYYVRFLRTGNAHPLTEAAQHPALLLVRVHIGVTMAELS